MKQEELFKKIWDQYSNITPQAEKIHNLLSQKEERIVNDHVAYRSVNKKGFGIDVLSRPFLDLGYKQKATYYFAQKKLDAAHFEHKNSSYPKVFISELRLEDCSKKVQRFFDQALTDTTLPEGDSILTCGRLWGVNHSEYQELYKDSEYAAWFAAFGYCANHFTVYVNNLDSFEEVRELNEFLEKSGFKLNSSGGKIKGSPQVGLEQSSTLADETEVHFNDGDFKVPSCYYEFAKRYALEGGEIFQGFVEGSADKIFESTNKK